LVRHLFDGHYNYSTDKNQKAHHQVREGPSDDPRKGGFAEILPKDIARFRSTFKLPVIFVFHAATEESFESAQDEAVLVREDLFAIVGGFENHKYNTCKRLLPLLVVNVVSASRC